MLVVKLFGPGEAHYCEKRLSGFPHQQSYLLFCYLLINKNQPHHRDRLAAVFWSDYPTNTARKYLRNSLWRLRQALQSAGAPADEYLFISEDTVSFIASSRYSLDVEIFTELATSLQSISEQKLSAQEASQLESVVDLYTGDLLEGVYDDWCLYDREHLRLLYLNTLFKLMVYHTLHSNYPRGLYYGERILSMDNTREMVHRQLMLLYYLSGNRNAALAQNKRCCQILREELGVRPMDETQRLYEQILRNQVSLPGRLAMPGSSSPPLAMSSKNSLAENALHRLHRLQDTMEETRSELSQIERLLSEALGNSKA